MYRLARFILVAAVVAGLLDLVTLAALGWPVTALPLIVAIAIHFRAGRRRGSLTTLGSARWADVEDLQHAGMVGASYGLILGRLERSRRPRRHAIRDLFNRRKRSREVCTQFFMFCRRGRKPVVRLPNAIHTAVFSPSGGGKGVSCVIPFLMTCPESAVVIDFKGENARISAEHRRKYFGHKVVLLDPYKQVTQTPDSFNPLSFIEKDSTLAIDACNELAKAIVVRSDQEKEPHWADSAEAWIAAIIGVVLYYGTTDEGMCSLQTVRDILCNPQKLETAIKLMIESKAWNGMMARMGGQLLHYVDKEKSSTMTTVSRHLRFLDSFAVAGSTGTSNFNPSDLAKGKTTIYLILPPDQMKSQAPLLRLWIACLMRAVVSRGLQERNKVHFILDEAATLGHLDTVDDAIDKYRGYGIRLQLYYQSLGQLKKCFPNGQDQTLLSNATQVFFGVNDQAVGTGGTADYVSARLGERTIVVDSGGEGTGQSLQWSTGTQQQNGSRSVSRNQNRNWQQQARKLLKPEEVITLPPRTAITFTPGMPPIRTTLLRYYEERLIRRRPGMLRRCCTACLVLTVSAVLFLVLLLIAIGLIGASINNQAHMQHSSPYTAFQ